MEQKDDFIQSQMERRQKDSARAKEMAKASIYDDALFVGQWAGYDVYEPIFNDGEVHYTGFPQYILAKDGALRWTDNSESLGVMETVSLSPIRHR